MRWFATAFVLVVLSGAAAVLIGSDPGSDSRPPASVETEAFPRDLAFAEPPTPITAAPSVRRTSTGPRVDALAALDLGAISAIASPSGESCGGTPVGVDAFSQVFEERGPEWAAGDLMERYALPDGRVLWIFGDTWSGEVSDDNALGPPFEFVRSSLLVERNGCFDRLPGFGDGSWIPSVEEAVILWPQEAFLSGRELYVFAVKIVADDSKPDGLNFRQVGGLIAVYDLDDLSVPRTMVFDVPDVRGNPFGWGPVLWEGELYLYAHEEPTGTFVARLDPDDLGDPANWEFWRGDGWTRDVLEASSVAPFRLRVYLRVGAGLDGSAPFGAATVPFLAQELYVFEAESPVGPWTLVQEIPLDAIRPSEPSWAYEPLAVQQSDSTTVFAVNFLPQDTLKTLQDVTLYGPRFLLAEN